jgi:riboflavin kinase / FMN adenylyltransferase
MNRILPDKTAAIEKRPLHLAIGMFDGVHLGHRAIINMTVDSARSKLEASGVLTFKPHPSHVLYPNNPTLLLMQSEQKVSMLQSIGINFVIEQDFTKEFSTIAAEKFAGYLKEKFPLLKSIYVGENFRFGKGGKGDIEALIKKTKALGINVFSIQNVKYNGQTISSSQIREDLRTGKIQSVNEMLGYPYFCEGIVVGGLHIGEKLGFPTLNISWSPELPPRYGVYAVQVIPPSNEKKLPAVANYGVKPTVQSNATKAQLEIHLLNPTQAYRKGDLIKVQWHHFIRPEKKFISLQALKTQMEKDKQIARKYLKSS